MIQHLFQRALAFGVVSWILVSILSAQTYIYDVASSGSVIINSVTITYSDGSVNGGDNDATTGGQMGATNNTRILTASTQTIDQNGSTFTSYIYMKLTFSSAIEVGDGFQFGDIDGSTNNLEFGAIIGSKAGTLVTPTYTNVGSAVSLVNRTVVNSISGFANFTGTVQSFEGNGGGNLSTSDPAGFVTADFGSDSIDAIYFIYGLKNTVAVDGVQVSLTTSSPLEDLPGLQAFPVEWLSFDVKQKDQAVQLTWSTAHELNNDYFNIQRSWDGSIFEDIGTVKGAGYSDVPLSYIFWDHEVALQYSSLVIYRLVQVDFDGNTSYSKQLSFQVQSVEKPFLSAYLDPDGSVLYIRFTNKLGANSPIRIMNSFGQMIWQENISGQNAPVLEKEIFVKNWPQGFYYVFLTTGVNPPASQKILLR